METTVDERRGATRKIIPNEKSGLRLWSGSQASRERHLFQGITKRARLQALWGLSGPNKIFGLAMASTFDTEPEAQAVAAELNAAAQRKPQVRYQAERCGEKWAIAQRSVRTYLGLGRVHHAGGRACEAERQAEGVTKGG
jgi:hypothetical protein